MKIRQLDGLVDELRFGTRLLFQELGDPWGHIAVRLPKSDGRAGFLLKHVRVTPPPGDPDAVMMFDYNGKLLEGERRVPWELPLYTAIFKTARTSRVSSTPTRLSPPPSPWRERRCSRSPINRRPLSMASRFSAAIW